MRKQKFKQGSAVSENEWSQNIMLNYCNTSGNNNLRSKKKWRRLVKSRFFSRGPKKPLDESESGEWKSWLKAQHSENEDHSIRSHHCMGNRWGNSGNSVRLYFFIYYIYIYIYFLFYFLTLQYCISFAIYHMNLPQVYTWSPSWTLFGLQNHCRW